MMSFLIPKEVKEKVEYLAYLLNKNISKAQKYIFYYLGLEKKKDRSISKIRERMNEEDKGINEVLKTVIEINPGCSHYELRASQLKRELKNFCKYVKQKKPKKILEIGTQYGGTLYIWCRLFESVSKVASIDLPREPHFVDKNKKKVFKEFTHENKLKLVRGNSHHNGVYKKVRDEFGKADLLFIDGDHTYEGVKKDFEMYKRLVPKGGIVAFHDIVPHVTSEQEAREIIDRNGIKERFITVGHPNWNVSKFWEEVSANYETKEFRSHPQQRGKGIGVLKI